MNRCALPIMLITLVFNFFYSFAQAQSPAIQWKSTLGGSADDVPLCIYQTTDNGFIVGGVTASKDGDVLGNHGGGDLWIVKLTATGGVQWKKALGGANQEKGTLIESTSDGGYIVGATTYSSNGDVKGYHGGGDIWVVKLTSNGVIQWQIALGGSALDEIVGLQESPSGGYLIGGKSSSTNGDVIGKHGGQDVWVVKLTAGGAKQWLRALGSSGNEELDEINPTADGGCILVSRISSQGGDISAYYGNGDLWIAKLDGSGKLSWEKTLGGSGNESWCSVRATKDGGYIVGTSTSSNDGEATGNTNSSSIWMVKLNSSGNIAWKRFVNINDKSSSFYAVHQTTDDGFIVGGTSNGSNMQALMAKLTSNGTIEWQKEYGGSKQEELYLLQQTSDGGFVAGGPTFSPDLNNYHSLTDTWMLKVDKYGNQQWIKAFGGSGDDWHWVGQGQATTLAGRNLLSSLLPNMKLQSSDGGYFFAVSSNSKDGDVTGLHYSARFGTRPDMWIVKLSADGQSTANAMVTPSKFKFVTEETLIKAKAFPNPFTTQTTIQFTAKQTGNATVDIYSMNGSKIRTVFNSQVIKGQTYYVPVQNFALPKATYQFQIRNNNYMTSGALIKK